MWTSNVKLSSSLNFIYIKKKKTSQVSVSKAPKTLQNSKHLLQSLDSIRLAHNGSSISFEYFWIQLAPTGSCHANYCGFKKLSRTNSSWTVSRVFGRGLAEEPQAGIAVSHTNGLQTVIILGI